MASDAPRMPSLPPSWESAIQRTQALVQAESFALEDLPGYIRGQPPSVSTWHNIDHTAIYPRIYGRECGANGIGRLREVALVEIAAQESFPTYRQDPAYFPQTGLDFLDIDIELMRDQSAIYEAALEGAGVIVHRVRYPDPPVSAFGPMRGMWAGNELLVVRGGSIIEKIAINPLGMGRSEYLAYWAMTSLGIPIIGAIIGSGVAETGPCLWLSEDVFVTARGLAFNDEGLQQVIPLVERTTLGTDFTVLTIKCSGTRYFDPETGASHHPDMVLGPLDVGKVIAYPPGLDFDTWRWLKDHEYEIVEVDREEQVQFAPANVTILEPGRVIMHAEAERAVRRVREAGIDVIEVPFSEFLRAGGGVHCATLRLARDPGPFAHWR